MLPDLVSRQNIFVPFFSLHWTTDRLFSVHLLSGTTNSFKIWLQFKCWNCTLLLYPVKLKNVFDLLICWFRP